MSFHDVYHIGLIDEIPFVGAYQRLGELAFEFLNSHDDNPLTKQARGFLVDQEVGNFFANKAIGANAQMQELIQQHPDFSIVTKDEVAFELMLSRVLLPNTDVFQKVMEEEAAMPPSSELQKTFAAYLMSDMLNHANAWTENKGVVSMGQDIYGQALTELREILKELLKAVENESHPYHQYLTDGGVEWVRSFNEHRVLYFDSAKRNLVEGVAKSLDAGVWSNMVDQAGCTAAQVAVENKSHKVLALLLQRGANPNTVVGDIQKVKINYDKIRLGKTLLHFAAENRDLDAMNLLLEAGANSCVYDRDKMAPIDYCIQQGFVDGVMLFLQRENLPHQHIRYLREQGLVHESCDALLEQYEQHKEGLAHAIHDCEVDALSEIIVADTETKFGMKVCFEMFLYNNVCKEEYEAEDFRVKSKDLQSPVGLLCSCLKYSTHDREKLLKFFDLLTESGASVTQKAGYDGTPLEMLIKQANHIESPSRPGIFVDRDAEKKTCLYTFVQKLLDAGAYSHKATEEALKAGSLPVLKLLMPQVDINPESTMVAPPLMLSVLQNAASGWKNPNQVASFKYLVEQGADLKRQCAISAGMFDNRVTSIWEAVKSAPVSIGFASSRNVTAPEDILAFCREHGAVDNADADVMKFN